MKRSKFCRPLAAAVMSVCMLAFSGCGSSGNIYPIETLPDEAKETITSNDVKIVNESVSSNGELDFDKTNEVLGKYKFKIYYDNSQGCFMSYAAMDANSEMKSVFQKTMRSFRSAFECGQSYKSYVTQGDEAAMRLSWKELSGSGNIFEDYANMDIYTPTWAGYDYASDKSPMIMWLDEVESSAKKEKGDFSISVYLSDLNENNGALANAGSKVKKILNSSSDNQLDFLIISYVLPFTGSISGYSIDKDGDSNDKDVTYEVSSMADRYYYAVAFGPHEALAMFDHKVKEGFSDLEKNYSRKLNVQSYTYRDIFYGLDETVTKDKNGEPVTDKDVIKNNPVVFALNDGKGNKINKEETKAENAEESTIEENKEDENDIFGELKNEEDVSVIKLSGDIFNEGSASGGDDIFGENSSSKQIFANLEELPEGSLSKFFSETAGDNTFAFKYVLPPSGNKWQCAVAVDNSDMYEYDVENAVSYVYVPKKGKQDVMDADEQLSGWLSGSAVSDKGIITNVSSDNVIVGSDDMLDSTKAVVVVSVPVLYKYSQAVKHYEIKQVDQSFIDWVDRCKVPEKTEKGKEYEKLTHTLFFDEFIDKITDGYRNISESGQKNLVAEEDPTSFSSVVSKVNIIVAADPDTCEGMK